MSCTLICQAKPSRCYAVLESTQTKLVDRQGQALRRWMLDKAAVHVALHERNVRQELGNVHEHFGVAHLRRHTLADSVGSLRRQLRGRFLDGTSSPLRHLVTADGPAHDHVQVELRRLGGKSLGATDRLGTQTVARLESLLPTTRWRWTWLLHMPNGQVGRLRRQLRGRLLGRARALRHVVASVGPARDNVQVQLRRNAGAAEVAG